MPFTAASNPRVGVEARSCTGRALWRKLASWRAPRLSRGSGVAGGSATSSGGGLGGGDGGSSSPASSRLLLPSRSRILWASDLVEVLGAPELPAQGDADEEGDGTEAGRYEGHALVEEGRWQSYVDLCHGRWTRSFTSRVRSKNFLPLPATNHRGGIQTVRVGVAILVRTAM